MRDHKEKCRWMCFWVYGASGKTRSPIPLTHTVLFHIWHLHIQCLFSFVFGLSLALILLRLMHKRGLLVHTRGKVIHIKRRIPVSHRQENMKIISRNAFLLDSHCSMCSYSLCMCMSSQIALGQRGRQCQISLKLTIHFPHVHCREVKICFIQYMCERKCVCMRCVCMWNPISRRM